MLHEDVLKVVDYWAAIYGAEVLYVRNNMDEVVMRANFSSQLVGKMNIWWKFAIGSKVVTELSIQCNHGDHQDIESPEELRSYIKNFFFFTNYGGRPVKR